MLLTWSKHQSGSADAVVDYLLNSRVQKTVNKQQETVVRDPEPELLSGVPELVRSYIDALPFKMKYRCATLSFAAEDIDVRHFNSGEPEARSQVAAAVDLFSELAFSGIHREARPPVLISTHTHVGRLEVSLLIPRAIGVLGQPLRSFNPHPPTRGSLQDWEAFEDVVNAYFGWADPRCPSRRQAVKPPDWMLKEMAELRRRQASGQQFVAPSDGRFKVWKICELATQREVDLREEFIARVDQALKVIGWKVRADTGVSIICDQSDGLGVPIVMQGSAFGDREEQSIDPFDAIQRRHDQIMRAPSRLDQAFKRRRVANTRLIPPDSREVGPSPDYRQTLNKKKPLEPLFSSLGKLVMRLRDRAAAAVTEWQMARGLEQAFSRQKLNNIIQELEATNEHIRQRQVAGEHGGAHRPLARNVDQRHQPAFSADGGSLGAARPDSVLHGKGSNGDECSHAALVQCGDAGRLGEP